MSSTDVFQTILILVVAACVALHLITTSGKQ